MDILSIFDFSIFASPSAWISLFTLIFLELVLGVDNLVFIAITTNRLPSEKQHIGRRLGLAGALIMRIIFLCFASFLVQLSDPLFTFDLGFYSHGISIRDLVLLAGGAYLIYKGIVELRDLFNLTEIKAEQSHDHKKLHQIALPQAVVTIMIMDLVFSIDSVITAVGLADHLIIMIIAVMLAVFMMMLFIDPISNFINKHPEIKILALIFIVVIGVLLVIDSLGIHTGMELIGISIEKLMVYFAMIFAILLAFLQMKFNKNLLTYRRSIWRKETEAQVAAVREDLEKQFEQKSEHHEPSSKLEQAAKQNEARIQLNVIPVFIGVNVYIMVPLEGHEAQTFKEMLELHPADDGSFNTLGEPITIEIEDKDDDGTV